MTYQEINFIALAILLTSAFLFICYLLDKRENRRTEKNALNQEQNKNFMNKVEHFKF